MSIELLNILNTLVSINPQNQSSTSERILIEAEIASQFLPKLSSNEAPDLQFYLKLPKELFTRISSAYAEEPLYKSLVGTTKIGQYFTKYFDKEKYSSRQATFLYQYYSIDSELSTWINQQSKYLLNLYDHPSPFDLKSADITSGIYITDFALRCILLEVARRWGKENYKEPIFWKISECLQIIASQSSGKILIHTKDLLIIFGQYKEISSQGEYSVPEFLAGANEDKNGCIIDNLIISMHAYDALLERGWQPDQREVESMQMTVDLFLQYLESKGFFSINQINDEIIINLDESLIQFRYSGSPFTNKTDQKKVRVIAPGWKFQDRKVIRPKVREIN